jgi:hypothetical protein
MEESCMNVIDLSRRLSLKAVRRLATRYRRQLLGGASIGVLAASSILLALPAMAHDGTATPLAACTTPLVTPCAPAVSPTPAAGVLSYTVTLPGIGMLNVVLDATGAVSSATLSGVDPAAFTSVVKVDGDMDKVTVTLTSVTDPTVVYKATVSVKPPAVAGGAPTITAKLKSPEKEDADEVGETAAEEAAEAAAEAAEHSTAKPVSAPKGGGSGEHHGGSGGGGGD